MSKVVGRFGSGSPAIVALKRSVVSFVVDPRDFRLRSGLVVQEGRARRVTGFELGFTDVRQLGRILLTGAMVVVPVWLALRLLRGRL